MTTATAHTTKKPDAGSKRIAPGLYRVDGTWWVELIDADHECAEVVDFVPCWRVEDGAEVLGEFVTKREALAAIDEVR